MSKIELNETNSGYNLQKINNNFKKIATEFNEKVLYRVNPDGEPNEMQNDLDMNGNRIYNLPTPLSENEAARLKDVQDAVVGNINANLIQFEPTEDISSTNVQGAIEETFHSVGEQIRQELAQENGVELVGGASRFSSSLVEITVGPGGEFSSINDALEEAMKYRGYFISGAEGVHVRIRLLAGFVMQEQVIVSHGVYMGHIEIVSDASVVQVDTTGLSRVIPGNWIDVDGVTHPYPMALFGASFGATLPTISAPFEFVGGNMMGIYVAHNSNLTINIGCGLIGGSGLTAIHGSHIVAPGSVFDNSQGNGVSVFRGSFIDFRDGVADNCTGLGAYVGSNSRLEALHASFRNAGSHGLEAYGGSIAHVREVDFTGAGGHGLYIRDGSMVAARGIRLNSATLDGVRTLNGGKAYLEAATINDVGGNGIFAHQGGYVTATRSRITGSGQTGILANEGSTVSCNEVVISSVGGSGILANNGSRVSAPGGSITNCGQDGIYAGSGSLVSFSNATITRSGRFSVDCNGSTVTMNGTTVTATGSGIQTIRAINRADINFGFGTLTGTTQRAIEVTRDSHVNIGGANIAGSQTSTVLAERGSNISAFSATVGEPTSGYAFECLTGSTIDASSTGTASLSKSANTVTGNGIIYRL